MSSHASEVDVLATRAARGDRTAFRALVASLGDETWRLALHALGGSTTVAGDALEHAWSTAWRDLPRRGDREVRLWLLGVVARSCEHVGPDETAEPRAGRPGECDGGADLAPWETLTLALQRLPWAQRTAWLLRRLHGLSAAEVGVVLDVPELVAHHLVEQAHAALSTGGAA